MTNTSKVLINQFEKDVNILQNEIEKDPGTRRTSILEKWVRVFRQEPNITDLDYITSIINGIMKKKVYKDGSIVPTPAFSYDLVSSSWRNYVKSITTKFLHEIVLEELHYSYETQVKPHESREKSDELIRDLISRYNWGDPEEQVFEYFRYFFTVLKQRLYGLPCPYPVMLNLYSPEKGVGKDWFSDRIRGAVEQLGGRYVSVPDIEYLLNHFYINHNFALPGLIHISELGRYLGDGNHDKLKNAITRSTHSGDPKGQDPVSYPARQAFIVTTNEKITEATRADGSDRRYLVITFKGPKEGYYLKEYEFVSIDNLIKQILITLPSSGLDYKFLVNYVIDNSAKDHDEYFEFCVCSLLWPDYQPNTPRQVPVSREILDGSRSQGTSALAFSRRIETEFSDPLPKKAIIDYFLRHKEAVRTTYGKGRYLLNEGYFLKIRDRVLSPDNQPKQQELPL